MDASLRHWYDKQTDNWEDTPGLLEALFDSKFNDDELHFILDSAGVVPGNTRKIMLAQLVVVLHPIKHGVEHGSDK